MPPKLNPTPAVTPPFVSLFLTQQPFVCLWISLVASKNREGEAETKLKVINQIFTSVQFDKPSKDTEKKKIFVEIGKNDTRPENVLME